MTYTTSQQRREHILAQVLEKRHIAAKDLAATMDVSEATVRRDMKALADAGEIELVYGGATLPRPADFSFRSKGMRNVEEKRVIGRLAAELIVDEDQVFFDSGTTCFELLPFIKRRRGLSVIVNSARLAMELDVPSFNVIALGGKYRPDRMDTVGPLALASLEQMRGYLCFIGADGISREFGLTAVDLESATLYRQAVQNARETVLLADHSKFASPSLFKIVDWTSIARVVTDLEPAAEWLQFFESRSIKVIFPGNPSPSGRGPT